MRKKARGPRTMRLTAEADREWSLAEHNQSLISPVHCEVMVGAKGFEPSTPASRTQCATGLRYAPTG